MACKTTLAMLLVLLGGTDALALVEIVPPAGDVPDALLEDIARSMRSVVAERGGKCPAEETEAECTLMTRAQARENGVHILIQANCMGTSGTLDEERFASLASALPQVRAMTRDLLCQLLEESAPDAGEPETETSDSESTTPRDVHPEKAEEDNNVVESGAACHNTNEKDSERKSARYVRFELWATGGVAAMKLTHQWMRKDEEQFSVPVGGFGAGMLWPTLRYPKHLAMGFRINVELGVFPYRNYDGEGGLGERLDEDEYNYDNPDYSHCDDMTAIFDFSYVFGVSFTEWLRGNLVLGVPFIQSKQQGPLNFFPAGVLLGVGFDFIFFKNETIALHARVESDFIVPLYLKEDNFCVTPLAGLVLGF
ncbi:MAG: hypothetical protein GY854_05845 [Deltaproteobacteria bacterium]|nr:hypothetical protein [Deltaproteobacteria bacterium]